MRSTSARTSLGDEMVDLHGDTLAAGRRDQLGRLLDGLRPGIFGLLLACRAAGDIDGGAGGAELDRDAAAGAARCAGDQRDLSFKRHRNSPVGLKSRSIPLASPPADI